MAKMKTFAVDVEYTIKRTIFVNARRAGGAELKLSTIEGIRDALRYDDDHEGEVLFQAQPKDLKIVNVREAGI